MINKIKEYINYQLKNKNISLGSNNDIFEYNHLKITNVSPITVDIFYTEDCVENIHTIILPQESFHGSIEIDGEKQKVESVKHILPHFDKDASLTMNPIYKSLFEIDFNNDDINDMLESHTFKYKLKRNQLKLFIHIFEETNITDLINTFNSIENINIKQHNVAGNIINDVSISKSPDYDYDYELCQDWNEYDELLYFVFIIKGVVSDFNQS